MASRVPIELLVSIYCWYAFEVALVVRDVVRRKGRLRRDRGTRAIVSVTVVGSVVVAGLLQAQVPARTRRLVPGLW
jgi:hypothetical protein